MFDLDKWQEIYFTLSKNKLRTFLTGFSVAWGIFMLVILLAAGKGFENGVKSNFSNMSPSTIEVGSGETSLNYKGMKPGRKINFVEQDIQNIKQNIPNIEEITAVFYAWGDNFVSYKNNEGSFQVIACHAGYNAIDKNNIFEGRFLNENDVLQRRKVAVIGVNVKDALFKNEFCVGKFIVLKGVPFQVIGYFKDQGKPWRQGRIFVPFTTAQLIFNGGNEFGNIKLSLKNTDAKNSNEAVTKIKQLLGSKHQFDPLDPKAVWVFNFAELLTMLNGLFAGIQLFVWVIGIGTIIAGIVGVSNIMIIVVKDRTKEIGIRKALGATPWSIIALIVQEAVVITSVFGYIGLALGVGLVQGINLWLQSSEVSKEMFTNPEINFNVAIAAVILLVFCGAFAGFIPARRAAQIPPVVALREE